MFLVAVSDYCSYVDCLDDSSRRQSYRNYLYLCCFAAVVTVVVNNINTASI
jgi:hypothetical protein